MKTLAISLLLLSFTTPVTTNYKQAFGSDYAWAINWLQRNDALIEKYATRFAVAAKELKAIVFPELIRYNTVYDAIEINSLKYLYVREGREYADFSVGYFQMKPSFAETVEQDANRFLNPVFLQASGFDKLKISPDNKEARKARIGRITHTEQQIIYLCAFYKICLLKFAGKSFASVNDKVKFYATCYNAGYRRSYEEVATFQAKKYFHTGKIWVGTLYNYADISNYYFSNE